MSTSRFLHRLPALGLVLLALGTPSALAAPGHGHGRGPAYGYGYGRAVRPLFQSYGATHRPRSVVVAPRPVGRWEVVWVPPVIELSFDSCGRRYERVRVAGYWQKVWRPAPVAYCR